MSKENEVRQYVLQTLEASSRLRGDAFVAEVANKTGESKKKTKDVIRRMIEEGVIVVDSNFVMSINKDMFKTLQGVIRASKEGYAFCEIIDDEKGCLDYFIPHTALNGAVHKDIVLIKPALKQTGRKNPEAEVVEIIERGNKQVVGVYYKSNLGHAIVQPCDEKLSRQIYIEPGVSKVSANPGDRVVVKLMEQPKIDGAWFTGEVRENLGPSDSIEALLMTIVREHEITEEFPQEVLDYCKTLKPPTEEEIAKRKDLRNLKTFTIDGADARDLDDAVSIARLPNGNYQLGVHIADVGEYVKLNNPIDKEAFNRGTSVYFPAPNNLENSKIRAVIPMIPEALSNDLCSLNPHTDKLTMTCFMEIDAQGNIVDSDKTFVCESVINTCHRLTYDQVYKVLQGDKAESENLKDIKDDLLLMNKLSHALTKKRKEEGALTLDLPEPKFVFDDNGHVVAVKEREQNDAHKLIENFMVAANQTVAKKFCDKNVPFVYRVHKNPDQDKLKQALDVIKACSAKDFGLLPERVDASFLERVLNSSDDPIVNQAINSMVLRALPKAYYSNQPIGHFGLGLKDYCHFTSPIRRYPDLTIHRIIKGKLHKKLDYAQAEQFVLESATHSSACEVNADRLEREVDDLWCCEYMRDKVGQSFDVVVSSVMPFGVFVKIPETGIEGLIRIDRLPNKNYIYDEKTRTLWGTNTKFAIGDKLKAKLENVNMLEREIDFGMQKSLNLIDDNQKKLKNQKGGSQKSGGKYMQPGRRNKEFKDLGR